MRLIQMGLSNLRSATMIGAISAPAMGQSPPPTSLPIKEKRCSMVDWIACIISRLAGMTPRLGRFISPDTVVQNPYNPQDWDRYAYSNNNPINYTDPTGHSTECSITEKYCSDGQLDTKQKALDFADDEQFRAEHSGTTTYFGGLSEGDQETLQEGGVDAGAYNDTVNGSEVASADAVHDPLTYIIAGAGGLGVASAASTLGGGGASSAAFGVAGSTEIGASSNGSNVVYQYVEGDVTKYVGITNDFARRASEHLNASGWNIDPILGGLSRYDARAVEQALIENIGLR